MPPLNPSSAGFSTGIPIMKPKKEDRPGTLRKKQLKEDLKKWAEDVKIRAYAGRVDGIPLFQCARCKQLFRWNAMHAHHPITRGSHPGLRTSQRGEALCAPCHLRHHNQ